MPQENPFDIQSDLTPYQDKEMEPIFKTTDLDDFLLPPVLGDQITDTTLMHKYLPRQSDIDKIMEQIKRKYLTNYSSDVVLETCKQHISIALISETYT